jgi:hypothetical protein
MSFSLQSILFTLIQKNIHANKIYSFLLNINKNKLLLKITKNKYKKENKKPSPGIIHGA